jgi:zinc and cadmium transporter
MEPEPSEALLWIVGSGVLMAAVALVGAGLLLVAGDRVDRMLTPLVGLAAGSLIGGAFFHLLPAGLAAAETPLPPLVWFVMGFTAFFLIEQMLHRHHCRRASASCREPVTWLILVGDGLHNLLGGLAIGGIFVVDVRLGLTAWVAAVAHEIPQELGDFAVLVRGGWSPREALKANVLSASTFLLGGVLAWTAAFQVDISFLLPLAAGNFTYIAASDLVPEVAHAEDPGTGVISVAAFLSGLGMLYLLV